MMAHQIAIEIRNKIARQTDKTVYVCGNSDFEIVFSFDSDWDAYITKTARFIKDNRTFTDVLFTGNICPVPILENTYQFQVGVFAGNLSTTTKAVVSAKKSVLCDHGPPAAPTPEVYEQLQTLLQNGLDESLKNANHAEEKAQEASESASQAKESENQAAESARNADASAQDANTSAGNAAASEQAAKDSQDAAAQSAHDAAQSASQSGYMAFEIDENGHLIYYRTENVNVNFSLKNGRLVLSGTI